jgi:chromatin assembly factor 1 subunit A
MRLNNFFAKPQLPSSASSTVPPSPSKKAPNGDAAAETPRTSESDYKKAFPEFFLQSHTIVAPPHRFDRDSDALKHVRETIDTDLNSADRKYQQFPFLPSEIFHMIPYRRRCGRQTSSVRDLLQQIQTLESGPSPLSEKQQQKHRAQLRRVTMKSLKFGEDIRPPYQGTYTRTVPETTALKLSRNPYYRGLPDTNYDYDSEAEWEEPEEGEDLDSEEEDEGSDEGEDDMDGFLDDEDDALVGGKRRLIVGDLEPVNSGIRWATGSVDDELKQYQIETISDAVKFPIDPFSTVYWQKPRAVEQASAKNKTANNQAKGANTPSIFKVPNSDKASAGSALPPPPATKAKRPFPPEQLEEFKQVIEGSDLSKIGVVEILKKRYVFKDIQHLNPILTAS